MPDSSESKQNNFLLEEKSLLDIYIQHLKVSHPKFNMILCITFGILLSIYTCYTPETSSKVASFTREIADISLSFSVNILGFLIAGFSIFATLGDKSMFIKMAHVTHPSGLSYLKYSFFTFIHCFIVFIIATVLGYSIKTLGAPAGPISLFLSAFKCERVYFFVSALSYVTTGTFFFYCLMVLKSFIFNIYHVSMFFIRADYEKQKQNLRKDQ